VESLRTSYLLTSETSRQNGILKIGNKLCTAYWYAHTLYRRGSTREKVRKALPSYTGTHTTDTIITINPVTKAGLRAKYRSRDPSNIEAILHTRPGRRMSNKRTITKAANTSQHLQFLDKTSPLCSEPIIEVIKYSPKNVILILMKLRVPCLKIINNNVSRTYIHL
jgi:hypothetical protein